MELSTIIENLFDKEGLSPFLGDESIINLPVNRWDAYTFFFTTFYFINYAQIGYEYEGEGEEILHTLQNLKDVKLVYFSNYSEYEKSEYALQPSLPVICLYANPEEGIIPFIGEQETIKALAIHRLNKQGIMKIWEGKVKPSQELTRAEAVTILHRLYNYAKEQGVLSEYSSK